MNSIKILTVCYNSALFVENLFHNISHTCGLPFSLTVVDNGSDEQNISRLKQVSSKYKSNLISRQQGDIYAPSRYHGEAIHCGIDTFSDDDIAIIVDCDSSFIRPNWGMHAMKILETHDHFTCRRPGTPNGCGVWFSAFPVRKVRENNINFLPRLNPDGSDKKCPDRWDVGSDMIRMESWKPLICHPKIRFQAKGHVWMLDNLVFLDHMGKSRSGTGFTEWKRWLDQKWGISNHEKRIRIK